MGTFHSGEVEVQGRLGVREEAEPIAQGIAAEIPRGVRLMLRDQRMAAAASLDERGRPWASLLTGPPGFIQAADERLLSLATTPIPGDVLVENLKRRAELGLLVIDPRTRLRLRVNGRGLLSPEGVFLVADQVYGNCSKYVQKRRLVADSGNEPGEARRSSSLDERERAMVARADTFFIATWHPAGGADVSHRGGRPGFVRVLDERTLEFPDYPGNNMFNTLGNLVGHPKAGLLFVDFERGDLLQVVGEAQILWEPKRAVRVAIDEVHELPGASPLRLELVEPSPANPPVTA